MSVTIRLRAWRRLALLSAVLTGCGVVPTFNQAPPVGAGAASPQEAAPSRAPTPAATTANPAVLGLLDDAATQERAGQFEQAAAVLERALRLEPRNAMLWHRLARLRLSQGQWQTAADLAAKSNSLSGGNADLQTRNWELIAEAKERQGDRDGAREARARVQAGGVVR